MVLVRVKSDRVERALGTKVTARLGAVVCQTSTQLLPGTLRPLKNPRATRSLFGRTSEPRARVMRIAKLDHPQLLRNLAQFGQKSQ